MAKYILVLRGSFLGDDYEGLKNHISEQYQAKGMDVPIFAQLPGDEYSIEVVWIDEEMEKYHFATSVNSTREPSYGELYDSAFKDIADKYPRIDYP